MITCPYCGTSYTTFQSNCQNCGGPLPASTSTQVASQEQKDQINLAPPPAAPRQFPDSMAWRILWLDGAAIALGVVLLIGGIFSMVGLVLTLPVVTAFVGIPFALIGLLMVAISLPLFIQRYRRAQQMVDVMRLGQAVLGEIRGLEQNMHVRVNNRSPWIISYCFKTLGRDYDGKVTTLDTPDAQLQPGSPAYVFYMPANPERNAIYPANKKIVPSI